MKNDDQKPPAAAESAGGAFMLRTLGKVSLTDATGEPAKLRTRKALLLLACLATKPGQDWTRAKLATLFWADRQDEQAKNSLRSALSDIRRVLGADALVVEGDSVRLAAGIVATDIERLRALASTDSIADTGSLNAFYGGDFLIDVDAAGESFDWIVNLRAIYRDTAAAILEGSIARLAKSKSPEPAILRARELVSLDPLREKSHRLLMQLHADNGERSKAIAQFQACRQMLQHELGVEPSAETRQLADDIAVHKSAALADLHQLADAPGAPTANRSTAASVEASTGGDDGDTPSIRHRLQSFRL